MKSLQLAVCIVALVAMRGFAQTPSNWPPPRSHHTLIFEPKTRTVLLYGGMGMRGAMGELWRLDPREGSWQKIESFGGPKESTWYSVSIDTIENAAYLVGGFYDVGSKTRNETWRLDLESGSWSQVRTNEALPSRADHGADYDPATGTIYITGGWKGYSGADQKLNDTWKLPASNREWTQVMPSSSSVLPPPCQRCAAFLDRTGQHLYRLEPNSLDIWWQDLTSGDWHRFDGKITPPEQRTPQFVFDPKGNAIYLFPTRWPNNYVKKPLESVWRFSADDNNWLELKRPDEPHGYLWDASVFDPVAHAVYLVGAKESGAPGEVWSFQLDRNEWQKLETKGDAAPLSGTYGQQYALVLDSFDKRLFLVGSPGQDAVTLDTWQFSLDSHAWKQFQPQPPAEMPPRYEHSAVLDSIRKKLYVIGGRSRIEQTYSDTWSYDLIKGKWSSVKSDAPLPPISSAVAIHDSKTGRVFLLGGAEQGRRYSDAWTLDEQAGGWKNLGKAPEPPMINLGPDSTNRSFYALGGDYLHISSAVLRFDLGTESWERLPIDNAAPPQPWLAVLNDSERSRIIVLTASLIKGFSGGVIPQRDRTGNITGVWSLDLKKRVWEKIGTSATPEGIIWRAAEYDPALGRVVVIGCKSHDRPDLVFAPDAPPDNTPLDQIWAFDVDKKLWRQLQTDSAPVDRINPSITVVPKEHALYLLGGAPDPGDTSSVPEMPAIPGFWRLDLVSGAWTRVVSAEEPAARMANSATYDPRNDAIYVIGGMDDFQPLNDIWRFDLKSRAWTKLGRP